MNWGEAKGISTWNINPSRRHLLEITNLGTERKTREQLTYTGICWVNKLISLSGPNSVILESAWTLNWPKVHAVLVPAAQPSLPQKAPLSAPHPGMSSQRQQMEFQQQLFPQMEPQITAWVHESWTPYLSFIDVDVLVWAWEEGEFVQHLTPDRLLAGLAGFARLCPGDQYEVSAVSGWALELKSGEGGVSCRYFRS